MHRATADVSTTSQLLGTVTTITTRG